ncbi:MAG: redoxin domain-containing protein [Nocardioides sp.]
MRSVAVALAMVLGLAACGTDAEAGSDATTSLTDQLEFTADTVDGVNFEGTALADKDVVLWFWAPWCTSCRREAPFVAKAQAANPEVTFVGVAGLSETDDDMIAFVEDYDVGAFEHLNDVDGSLWQRFDVVRQPAYAFIDDTGTVETFRGELGEDGIADRVATLTGN